MLKELTPGRSGNDGNSSFSLKQLKALNYNTTTAPPSSINNLFHQLINASVRPFVRDSVRYEGVKAAHDERTSTDCRLRRR